ncbi:putative transcriptional regulator [Constrictibacter sp. MBR-5]|uniref:hypothetical protein n=1 Tax=Constrictibacter sp. MBR-5 TaxID=3156467 RepID=UPI0033965C70
MIPANLLDKAARRLLVIDRSARLIAAAQAFDHPETRLIIVNDPEGIMVDVVSRTDIVTSATAPGVHAPRPSRRR